MAFSNENFNNSPYLTLRQFVFKNPDNIPYIIAAIAIAILQFIIFKYIYPFPNFLLGDSYTYIQDAQNNAQIATHPIGYGMFLRFFSAITISDTALVGFQFFLLQVAAISLNFTFYYFFSPERLVKIYLLLAVILNPLFFVIANTISSDNLSLSLGIIWITLLIWIIYKPTPKAFYAHAIVLFLALTIRFSALFYPVISLLAFFFSKSPFKWKIQGMVLSIILVAGLIIHNNNKYYQLCGIHQFAPFSGWQMANNALYTYRYVSESDLKKVPEKFNKLDSTVRQYFQDATKRPKADWEQKKAFDGYMWASESPLWTYMMNNISTKDSTVGIKRWATAAPFYKEYGTWIILHYPKEFFHYIIIPHIQSWLVPPMYSLQNYNFGYANVTHPDIIKWFKYKSSLIKVRLIDINILDQINGLYPIWSLFINIAFGTLICFFLIFKRKQKNTAFFKSLLFMSIFWFVNFGFNVFASQIEVRYLLFPIHIMTIYALLLTGE